MTHWVNWDHVMIVWSEYNAREVRINTGWCGVVAGNTDRVAQRGVSAFSVVQPQCWVLCCALQCQGPADRSRSVACCHDNSTVMTTHTQLLCTMCDDTMTCDYMTIVSRVTVIFTLSCQLVCRSQQRNEFNINIVTVTPDSESRAVGLSPPSL